MIHKRIFNQIIEHNFITSSKVHTHIISMYISVKKNYVTFALMFVCCVNVEYIDVWFVCFIFVIRNTSSNVALGSVWIENERHQMRNMSKKQKKTKYKDYVYFSCIAEINPHDDKQACFCREKRRWKKRNNM